MSIKVFDPHYNERGDHWIATVKAASLDQLDMVEAADELYARMHKLEQVLLQAMRRGCANCRRSSDDSYPQCRCAYQVLYSYLLEARDGE